MDAYSGWRQTISSDSGTLNLTNAGVITGATFGLTLTGSGAASLSSVLGTTTGILTRGALALGPFGGKHLYRRDNGNAERCL